MNYYLIGGILLPFFGTSIGSSLVFLMNKSLNPKLIKGLDSFAAGVMTAACVWSLLLPAIERSQSLGKASFVPCTLGFWLGVAFMILISRYTVSSPEAKAFSSPLVFSVTLHNIPEGMAVGAALASCIGSGTDYTEALILSLGIAVQNLPEGAIISMPLKAGGRSKPKAFASGILSGAVEPVAAALTVLAAKCIVPLLPIFLSFAAGAMIFAVITELVPESNSKSGVIFYTLGFTVMMSLDVALG